jgi:hypothetical protein
MKAILDISEGGLVKSGKAESGGLEAEKLKLKWKTADDGRVGLSQTLKLRDDFGFAAKRRIRSKKAETKRGQENGGKKRADVSRLVGSKIGTLHF